MTPLDAMKAITERTRTWTACHYCGADLQAHTPDCPLLGTPKIIRALEAAELARDQLVGGTWAGARDTLVAALGDEGAV